jgi:hypothetical protein
MGVQVLMVYGTEHEWIGDLGLPCESGDPDTTTVLRKYCLESGYY